MEIDFPEYEAEISQIRNELAQILKDNYVDEWLTTPLACFKGYTPLQVIVRGEGHLVYRVIYELESGIPL